MKPEPQPHEQEFTTYTISSTPGGRVETAVTIPDALATLATQLAAQLPKGPVEWQITDPAGTKHRGSNDLNGRLDLITPAIEELVDDLYTQLHRAADGGPRQARAVAAEAGGSLWPRHRTATNSERSGDHQARSKT